MQKSFMTDYNADEGEFKSERFSWSYALTCHRKNEYWQLCLSQYYLCSRINGKIFHTYNFNLVSTTRTNYFKSSLCLEQLQNNPFLHLVVESCYYRGRWALQKHSVLSPWFVILLQDPVQERGQSRAENETVTLYCIGS